MNTRVAVLGATGVYGRHLLPRLAAAGLEVRALVRNPSAAGTAVACGAEVAQADIFDVRSLTEALGGCEAAINLATSLPSPTSQGGDYAANDKLRREGTRNWVQACEQAGVARVIQQSIAMVHAGGGASVADESTSLPLEDQSIAGAAIAAARAMEATIEQSALDWVILRGALFYGPGTGFDDDWLARARAGKLRLPGDGSDYVSLIHIADMADATVTALTSWPSRRALVVSDDRPPTWRELFEYVCATSGSTPPQVGGKVLMPSFRVSNALARKALSWRPRYSDFRSGLVR